MVIDACLGGKPSKGKEKDPYEEKLKDKCVKLSSIHLVRNALALPNRLFGQPPEVILIGIKSKTNYDKGEPIIDIEFGNVPTSGNPDQILVEKHKGT